MSKYAWKYLIDTIDRGIDLVQENYQIDLKDRKWLLAVSGGLDSMALLHACFALHENLVVAHVNYNKRGQESDADEQLVSEISSQYKIPFFSKSIQIDSNSNFQEKAREERYRFFSQVQKDANASLLVMAHHYDDKLENALFRFFRGSSAEAILGTKTIKKNIFRPLLNLTKSDLELAMIEKGFVWRVDQSNYEVDFDRNWLRNDLIPRLNDRFNAWDKHIINKAVQEQAFITFTIDSIKSILNIKNGILKIDESFFSQIPKEIQNPILHHQLNEMEVYLSDAQLRDSLKLLSAEVGKKVQLSSNIYMSKEMNALCVWSSNENKFEHIIVNDLNDFLKNNWLVNEVVEINKTSSDLYLDKNKLNFPLVLRPHTSQETFALLGSGKNQRVRKYISTTGLYSFLRQEVRVLVDSNNQIIAIIFPNEWASYNKISDICKVTSSTKKILQLKPF